MAPALWNFVNDLFQHRVERRKVERYDLDPQLPALEDRPDQDAYPEAALPDDLLHKEVDPPVIGVILVGHQPGEVVPLHPGDGPTVFKTGGAPLDPTAVDI